MIFQFSESFVGESTILSPTPGLDMDVTQRYRNEIVQHSIHTPIALEQLQKHFSFSLETFLTEHPQLTDEQGVVVFGDSLRCLHQSFSAVSTLMRYDKSKI